MCIEKLFIDCNVYFNFSFFFFSPFPLPLFFPFPPTKTLDSVIASYEESCPQLIKEYGTFATEYTNAIDVLDNPKLSKDFIHFCERSRQNPANKVKKWEGGRGNGRKKGKIMDKELTFILLIIIISPKLFCYSKGTFSWRFFD